VTPPTCPPSAAAVSLGPVRTSHRRTRPSPGALDAVSTNAGFKLFDEEEPFEGLVPDLLGSAQARSGGRQDHRDRARV
jgi:hypothetical protein